MPLVELHDGRIGGRSRQRERDVGGIGENVRGGRPHPVFDDEEVLGGGKVGQVVVCERERQCPRDIIKDQIWACGTPPIVHLLNRVRSPTRERPDQEAISVTLLVERQPCGGR